MNTEKVIATLSYVKRFAGTTVLIKLGGAALQDSELVQSICKDLTLIRSVGVSVVLVHGGGPSINQELTSRGITWEFIEGQRVTTPEMMDVIEMVLCGSVNRKIVRTLNQAGVRAVGMSGTDASTLYCKKSSSKLGQVGMIDKVNTDFINSILNTQTDGIGAIPVIAPIGIGKNGEAYNINADWAASRIAQALGITKVLFVTDQNGILDSQLELIPELDAGELENLIEAGVIKGGMLAKARTIIHALRNGVTDVHILNARRPHSLIEELFTDIGVGTVCRLRSRASQTKSPVQPPEFRPPKGEPAHA
ncbi:MAG: acetylglutamate kinase [Methylotenera sp.]|nr:acetylglutamate kinase [Oligoflexia bacterium]